jgi:3-oxoacyl-[acyl-carrier protein] reductase
MSEKMKLKGKVALITGAGRGIGKAIALEFAKEGADIVINYSKSAEDAKKVKNEIEKIGSKAIAINADVSNGKEVNEMVGKILSQFKKIDILVNNAGIISASPLQKLTEEDWDKIMNVNLKGVFLCSKAVSEIMTKQKGGKIVNISSIYGSIFGGEYVMHYCASKAGVANLTKSLAQSLAPYVQVNSISPGNIDTEMTRRAGDDFIKKVIEKTPLKRLGKPEEIAKAAVFLSSNDSDFITGQNLVVDGGLSLE